MEPRNDPGQYDLEVPVILHEWEPYFTEDMDVAYKLFSINGKMLGGGEPIRVRRSQRVLFRVLNASATLTHRLALPGHRFNVIALDGNAIASARSVPVLELAPAERVDAFVEMEHPGVWILGETRDAQRGAGMGIVVEYAGAQGSPRWTSRSPSPGTTPGLAGAKPLLSPTAVSHSLSGKDQDTSGPSTESRSLTRIRSW